MTSVDLEKWPFGRCAMAAFMVVCSCVSVEPLPVSIEEAGVVEATDASTEESSCSSCDPCRQCAEETGCHDAYLACAANVACLSIYNCAVQNLCTVKATIKDRNTCVTACAIGASVTSTFDPAIDLLKALGDCADTRCGGVCTH